MGTNFVLLTIDSLRADHAGSDLMPNLTEYADGGVRFSRAYSNGYSTPVSFPTILTGTYASHYGGDGYMADERPFLASAFESAEYSTAGFHTNPHLRDEKNYDVGFETYRDFDDEAGDLSRMRYLVTQNLSSDAFLYKILKRLYHFVRTTSGSTDYTEAPKLNDRALQYLDEEYGGEEPFFLWTHYMDVHYPFYPPDRFLEQVSDRSISNSRAISVNGKMHEDDADLTEKDRKDLQALYRGEVRYMDHHLGEFIEALKERGLYEDTVFVVTSDHGELFGEYGIYGHPAAGYEENFHVPLVCFGPGIPEGETVEEMVSLLDVPPTVADLFELGEDDRWDGESLVPAIEGESRDGEKTVFLGDEDVLSYQNESWRLVWWRTFENPVDPNEEWELWRLPECERVALDEHEDIVERFREQMYAFLDQMDDDETFEEPEVDEATEDRLEALGYK